MNRLEIPGFEILERVGRGGMATVWKARQVSLDRIVAIKVLSSHLATEAEDIERFKTEAQSEAKLKHPGIVQVYDASVEAGFCYIVMEFIDGYTIGEWVRRKSVLSEEDALLVAGYVVDALSHAWETAGVIHCDIKPDNVLIDSDGTPKVTDLGLARSISAMGVAGVTDEVMGTPAYMSPEQVQGFTDLDCRSDIYSLGAMLYQLVTGHMLFEGSTDEQVMDGQLTSTVPAALTLNQDLTLGVCGLIEKMLAKDRDNRYQDWHSVGADVARAKRGLPPCEPMTCAGLSTAEHTPMPEPSTTRSYRGAVASLLVTLVLGAVGVLAGIWLYGRLMDAVAPAAPPAAVQGVVEVKQADLRAERLLEQARALAAANPYDYEGSEQRYRRVIREAAGSAYAAEAQEEIRRLHTTRDAAVQDVMNTLDDQAKALSASGRLLDAAAIYLDYEGRLAPQTDEGRQSRAAALRDEHSKRVQQRRIREVEQRSAVDRQYPMGQGPKDSRK